VNKLVLVLSVILVASACANDVADVDAMDEAGALEGADLGGKYQLPCAEPSACVKHADGRILCAAEPRHGEGPADKRIAETTGCYRLANGKIVCAIDDVVAALYPYDAPELIGTCQ